MKRNSLEIRVWMLRNGLRRQDIEKATGLNGSNVTRTIDGDRNCRAALEYLVKQGCPVEYLDLPQDMEVAA